MSCRAQELVVRRSRREEGITQNVFKGDNIVDLRVDHIFCEDKKTTGWTLALADIGWKPKRRGKKHEERKENEE